MRQHCWPEQLHRSLECDLLASPSLRNSWHVWVGVGASDGDPTVHLDKWPGHPKGWLPVLIADCVPSTCCSAQHQGVCPPHPRGETTREEQWRTAGMLALKEMCCCTQQCWHEGFAHPLSSTSSCDFAPALAEKVEKYNREKQAQVSSAGHQLAQGAQSLLKIFLDLAGGGAGCPVAADKGDQCLSSK